MSVLSGEAVSLIPESFGNVTVAGDDLFVLFCWFVSVLSGEAVSLIPESFGNVTVAGDDLFVLFEKVC